MEALIKMLANMAGVSYEEMGAGLKRIMEAEGKLDNALRYFKLREDQIASALLGCEPLGTVPPGSVPFGHATEPAFMAEIRGLFEALNQRLERLENERTLGTPSGHGDGDAGSALNGTGNLTG